MPFFRGQKVVYIGPDFGSHPLTIQYLVNVPVPDCVYRIRSDEMVWQGAPGYLLEGIVNGVHPAIGHEMLIDTKFLRPVAEIKDQAFFTTGAPADTKGLDNRHKHKQKVRHDGQRALDELEQYRAKWDKARKAAAWYELKRRVTSNESLSWPRTSS